MSFTLEEVGGGWRYEHHGDGGGVDFQHVYRAKPAVCTTKEAEQMGWARRGRLRAAGGAHAPDTREEDERALSEPTRPHRGIT